MNQQELDSFLYGYNCDFEAENQNAPLILCDGEAFWKFIRDGYELLKKENPDYVNL